MKAGQLLFEIDDRPYQAALDQALGNLATQRATLRKYQLDVARYTPLQAQGAVSKQELDNAVQATRASEAQVQAAAGGRRERAAEPRLDARSTRRSTASPASRRSRSATSSRRRPLLTTISQVDPMKVTFPITRARVPALRRPDSSSTRRRAAPRTSRSSSSSSPTAAVSPPGRFHVVDRQVDGRPARSRSRRCSRIPTAILRPGLYAKVRAATGRQARRARSSRSARVQETQGRVPGGRRRTTTTRSRSARSSPASKSTGSGSSRKGSRPGERVVTEGLQKVRDGIAVVAKPDTRAAVTAAPPERG